MFSGEVAFFFCCCWTDFSVFAGYLFLGAYPLARFIIEYASGGDLYIRLGK